MFNNGLKTDEKQGGLIKRLKNIDDKTDNQLEAIKDHKDSQLGVKSIGYIVKELSQEAKNILKNLVFKKRLLTTENFF